MTDTSTQAPYLVFTLLTLGACSGAANPGQDASHHDSAVDAIVADGGSADSSRDARTDGGITVPLPSNLPACERSDFTRPQRDYLHGRGNGLAYLLIRCSDADLAFGPTKDYQPLYFEVRTANATFVLNRAQILSYQVTHHNWSDVLVGTSNGHVIRWRNITEQDPQNMPRSIVRVEALGDAGIPDASDASADAALEVGVGTVVVPDTQTEDEFVNGPA